MPTDAAVRWLVVMGVSGCGKSSIAQGVAQQLGLPLIEGDAFHSDANRERMRNGVPLTDGDRAAWLDSLGRVLREHPHGAVLTCSALKLAYRDRLRAAVPGLRFAWLDLDEAAALQRVAQRPGHFFPAQLVQSQFATLEKPVGEGGVLRVDAMRDQQEIVEGIVTWAGTANG